MEYFKAFNEESVCRLRKCPKRKTARHRGVRAGVIGSKSVTDDSKGERASERGALALASSNRNFAKNANACGAVLALSRLPPSELCMNRNNELEKTEVGMARRRRSEEGERGPPMPTSRSSRKFKCSVLIHSLTPSGTQAHSGPVG